MPSADNQNLPERLPAIPYEGHPLYGASKARLGQRLFALARVLELTCYVAGVRLWQLLRRRWGRFEKPSEALALQGILPVRLSASARENLKSASRMYFDQLEGKRNRVPRGARAYGDNQLDLNRSDAPDLYNAFEAVLQQDGLMDSISGYLRCRARLRKVTIQINDEWDMFWRAHFNDRNLAVPKTAFFHVDNTYDVVKAIFYVSDIGRDNGPFSFVPRTHRIKVGWLESLILRATDIWLDVYPAERHLFAALPKWLQKKAKFGDDIDDDSAWGQWLLENERTMTSADGDLFIFDVAGVHRGGLVANGERRIIQVMIN